MEPGDDQLTRSQETAFSVSMDNSFSKEDLYIQRNTKMDSPMNNPVAKPPTMSNMQNIESGPVSSPDVDENNVYTESPRNLPPE